MKENRFSSRKPLKIELAPTDVVDRFEDLTREVLELVGMSYDDCLVTDESCLCDVVTDDTPPDYVDRFAHQYGFELPNGMHTRIAEIVRSIATRRHERDLN